jgi:hypothetical protein
MWSNSIDLHSGLEIYIAVLTVLTLLITFYGILLGSSVTKATG